MVRNILSIVIALILIIGCNCYRGPRTEFGFPRREVKPFNTSVNSYTTLDTTGIYKHKINFFYASPTAGYSYYDIVDYNSSTTVSYYKFHPASGAIEQMDFSSPFFAAGAVLSKAFGAIFGLTSKVAGSGITNSRALGIAGEEAVGISGPKTANQVGGRTRFPDALTRTTLEEVKNVKYQSFTSQLRDYSLYSQQNGLEMILHTRSTTTLSKPLQHSINNGLTTHKTFP